MTEFTSAADRTPEQIWLDDAQGTARRMVAVGGFADDGSGHCENCAERWTLPADKASCPHKPICEDCWPNGCEACEAELDESIRRREDISNRIISAALELRTSADDFRETDMRVLDWRVRQDVTRHVDHTIESLTRVRDLLKAQVQI